MYLLEELQKALIFADKLREDLLKSRHLGYLLLLALLATIVAGLFLFILDPNVHSAFDGVWLAWVTMTHVGFGDVTPVSFLGRLLAGALILLGLVLFSLFTALVSATLIGKNLDAALIAGKSAADDEIKINEQRLLDEVESLKQRLEQLENHLLTAIQESAK